MHIAIIILAIALLNIIYMSNFVETNVVDRSTNLNRGPNPSRFENVEFGFNYIRSEFMDSCFY